MKTFSTTNTFASGAFLVRTQIVTVPVNSALGNTRFVVVVDSGNTVVESNETNNLVLATNATVIPALLTLQLPGTQLLEGTTMTGIVFRNGSTSQPLTVTITNDRVTEISFSLSATTSVATVTIPAGSSSAQFSVRALNDGMVDGSQLVNIFASAPTFPTALAQLIVLDAQVPNLRLTVATNSVTEGLTVAATVRRDYVTANPLTVLLQSSTANRLLV